MGSGCDLDLNAHSKPDVVVRTASGVVDADAIVIIFLRSLFYTQCTLTSMSI